MQKVNLECHHSCISVKTNSLSIERRKKPSFPLHLGDGSFDLILVKRSWRTGLLRFLWQVANDGRSIEDLPHVERYRVSEVLIRPMHTERRRLGNWSCDGELITGHEIQIRVHRQALNLFAAGIHFETLEDYRPIKTNKSTKSCCFPFQMKRRRRKTSVEQVN